MAVGFWVVHVAMDVQVGWIRECVRVHVWREKERLAIIACTCSMGGDVFDSWR